MLVFCFELNLIIVTSSFAVHKYAIKQAIAECKSQNSLVEKLPKTELIGL